MTYEPLHHKYRPQTFGELVGQEAIAATLTNAIEQQRIAPAYLFTGARGTGKTSSARILAKSLNCLSSKVPTATPCGICEVCQAIARGVALDVIEIDAASNTGVDNIRDLIERAQFAPVQCRYKVYIIDEVHMLSTAAFNALLKTLEEPPDRVVFVLATTDPQRVLPTIISRCQRFDYRRIPLDAMVAHLQHIADQENIAIAADAVTLVAQIAQGGLRDAESLLDQLSLLSGEISVEQVWDLVGSVPERDLLQLVQAIAQDNPESLLDSTRRLMDRGREPLIVLQNLASFYRDLLIAKTVPTRNDLVALTPPTWQQLCQLAQTFDTSTILQGQQHLRTAEVQLKHTTQPRLWLEVALMGLLPSAIAQHRPVERREAGDGSQEAGGKSQPSDRPPIAAAFALPNTSQIPKKPTQEPKSIVEPTGASTPKVPETEPIAASPNPSTPAPSHLDRIWQDVIQVMIPYSAQVMVRQQCQLREFNGHQAKITVSSHPLLKKAQSKMSSIEAAFETVFSRKITVLLEVSTSPTPAPAAIPDQHQSSPPRPVSVSPLPEVNGAEVNPMPQFANPTASPIPDTVPVPIAEQPLVEKNWAIDDDLTKAAKNLAEFFNGEVVDLDKKPDLSSPLSEPQETAQPTPKPSSWQILDSSSADAANVEEDDDDLPF